MVSVQPTNPVVDTLRSKGLRVTPQRVAVYDNLLGRTDHPTVDQIMLDLNKGLPISSKATVYSTLASLREAGLVREILLEEGVTRYDSNVCRHHHFRCSSCGAIIDVPWDAVAVNVNGYLPDGHAVTGYEVTFHGVCTSCQDS